MPCYHPLRGWRSKQLNESGKRSIVFKRDQAAEFLQATEVHLPCGSCIGCRLERSRQWAVRCVHEASLYDNNCFITLTYNDEHLPDDGSLHVEHFQAFMKRLREYAARLADKHKLPRPKIRFYHCGEYGDENARPHYHACIFNYDFMDKTPWQNSGSGSTIYTSDTLSEVWGMGFATIGDLTFESAAYVARYVMKKRTGPDADLHYQGLKPEYTTMSRRPGIGKGWYDSWANDVFPADEVIINGKSVSVPRFYDNQLELDNPELLSKIKLKRKEGLKSHSEDLTLRRLRVSEAIKNQSLTLLPRNYER